MLFRLVSDHAATMAYVQTKATEMAKGSRSITWQLTNKKSPFHLIIQVYIVSEPM